MKIGLSTIIVHISVNCDKNVCACTLLTKVNCNEN